MATRTPLFGRRQPGGVFTIVDYPTHTGNVWFVNSASATGADSAGYGQNPDAPTLTVDYAIGLASAGDTIYVAEGHNEGSTGVIFDADVAGIKIIGCGVGARRPTFDYDNAAATIDVGADDITLKNLIFRPSVTAVLIGVELETDTTGCVIENCEWAIGEDGGGTDEFVVALKLTSGNHDTIIRNNKILAHASAAQATHAISIAAASDRLTIVGNNIDGPYATGGIVEAAAGVNHVVENNNVDVTGTNYSFHGGSTYARLSGNLEASVSMDSGANFIGVDDANNAAATTNVVANRDGSVLERIEYLYDLLVDDETTNLIGVDDADNSAATTSVVANQDGSVLERLEQIQEAVNNGSGTSIATNKSIVDLLGTTGAALVDDALSVVGILGVNDADNAFVSSSVTANADGSILERLEYVQSLGLSMPMSCVKTGGTVENNTTDDIFTITGGPVFAQIYGYVTTIIGGAANGKLQITTTTPSATVELNAGAVAIDGDAAGTVYYNVGATSVFTPVTAGVVLLDPVTVEPTWFLLPAGTVKFHSSAAQTGAISWYMRYIPLGPSSIVAAAA